jgi:hypothetical protein
MYFPREYLPTNLIVDSNVICLNREQHPKEISKRTIYVIHEESRYRWLVQTLRERLNDYNKYHSELMLEIEDYREIEQTTTTFIYSILNFELEDSESNSEEDSEEEDDEDEAEDGGDGVFETESETETESDNDTFDGESSDYETDEDLDLFNEMRCLDLIK